MATSPRQATFHWHLTCCKKVPVPVSGVPHFPVFCVFFPTYSKRMWHGSVTRFPAVFGVSIRTVLTTWKCAKRWAKYCLCYICFATIKWNRVRNTWTCTVLFPVFWFLPWLPSHCVLFDEYSFPDCVIALHVKVHCPQVMAVSSCQKNIILLLQS